MTYETAMPEDIWCKQSNEGDTEFVLVTRDLMNTFHGVLLNKEWFGERICECSKSVYRKATPKELIAYFAKQDMPKEEWVPKNEEMIEVSAWNDFRKPHKGTFVGMLKGLFVIHDELGGFYCGEFARPLPAKTELTMEELLKIAADSLGTTPDLIVVKS